jgi:hypothetical protein
MIKFGVDLGHWRSDTLRRPKEMEQNQSINDRSTTDLISTMNIYKLHGVVKCIRNFSTSSNSNDKEHDSFSKMI